MTAILATDTSAYHRVLDRLRDNGRKVRESRPGQAMAQCPAHDDHDPSLSITKIEGSVLLHCHTGCHYEDVLAALRFDKRDLYDDPGGAEYRYTDRAGKVLRTVHRRPDKTFWQSGNTNGAATPLFRLPEVAAAVENGQTIYLVEGEKDVLAVEAVGGVATTAPQGAESFHKCDVSPLAGADVVAIPDRDEAGKDWAGQVSRKVAPIAKSLTFKLATQGHKDAADHIAAGYDLDELEPAADPVERSSWWPKDLTAVLEGTWRPPQPTVGKRSDGRGLFYPGKSHTVIGESEAAKGWFALAATRDELAAGNHVLYIDFEDDENTVVGRLITVKAKAENLFTHQAKSETIAAQFHYLRPESPLLGRSRHDLLELLGAYRHTLVIVDGVTEAMTMHNLNPLDNVDVARFNGLLIKPLVDSGAAVVSLDHVVKDREGRGRYALGGVHKLNVVSGAAYVLTNRNPFGVGMTGRSTLAIAKDRPGQLRPYGVRSAGDLIWYGDLVLESLGHNLAELSTEPPEQRDETWRPTALMGRISDLLAEKGKLSQRRILAGVKGKTDAKRAALDLLILDGYVSDKTPHELLKPYETEA